MRVIVVASQKGGSGKTTLSGHLAVQAVKSGAGPVAIIDTDPQGSLAEWWNQRDSSSPYFVHTKLESLKGDLMTLAGHGCKLAIIDTPPAITDAIQQVVDVADMVVIPIRPSPHDLRAAAATVELVEDSDRPFVFVVNGATARAKITGEAAVTLSQYGTVAPVTVHQRVDFASSMVNGATVVEASNSSKSAEEIDQLWGYLEGRLDKAVQKKIQARAEERNSDAASTPTGSLAAGVPRQRQQGTFGRRAFEEPRTFIEASKSQSQFDDSGSFDNSGIMEGQV